MEKKLTSLINAEFIAKSAEKQQQWHGWGSPVGLSILIVSVAVFIKLVLG